MGNYGLGILILGWIYFMDSLEELKLSLRKFAKDRDWEQFHSPKNLVMALSGEIGELAECFQWLTEDQSKNLTESQMLEVANEIADVQLYLIRLADKLNIDVIEVSNRKILLNADKYPATLVKGKSKKYTEY